MNMNKARYACADFVFAVTVFTGIWFITVAPGQMLSACGRKHNLLLVHNNNKQRTL